MDALTRSDEPVSVGAGLPEPALVLLGFSALTVALTYPLAFHLATLAYRPDNGDGRFSVWNVAWVARTLVADPIEIIARRSASCCLQVSHTARCGIDARSRDPSARSTSSSDVK